MARFQDLPRFISNGRYSVDIAWDGLPEWLRQYDQDAPVDMDPDFQRGHVWTREQSIRYLEFVMKGGVTGREILFNHPSFESTREAHCDLPDQLVLVDGKQRVSAVLAFLRDEVPVFGHRFSEFTDPNDRRIMFNRCSFKARVNQLQTRAELLQWYLDLNDGGVVHSQEEISRVRELLAAEPRQADPSFSDPSL